MLGMLRQAADKIAANPKWSLLLVAIVAVAIRLPLALHAPPFVDEDTRQYLKPAFNLLEGRDFGLPLVRTPGYPFFLAAIMWLLGLDFQRVLLVQHLAGIAIALVTVQVGRSLYGPGAGGWIGLLSGLLTALSAPLLIAEHYLLTETLFTLLLALAVWALLRAFRLRHEPTGHDRWWLIVSGGLLLGLAALCRPIGQLLLPLPALVCLVESRSWRRAAWMAAWTGAGAALVLCPWMAYNQVHHGVFEVTHRTGETLITHIALYADGRYLPIAPSAEGADPQRVAARRIVNEDVYGSTARSRAMGGPRITDDLRRQLGLSAVAADDLLRDLALEQIRAQPLTYLRLLLDNSWAIFAGQPADLAYAWETPASEVWGTGLPIHPQPASDAQNAWLGPLSALTRQLYDPAKLSLPLALLVALGLVEGARRRDARRVLLPGLIVVVLVLGAAGLVGVEYRYRYPADPFIPLIALGGLRALGIFTARAIRAVPGPRLARRMHCGPEPEALVHGG